MHTRRALKNIPAGKESECLARYASSVSSAFDEAHFREDARERGFDERPIRMKRPKGVEMCIDTDTIEVRRRRIHVRHLSCIYRESMNESFEIHKCFCTASSQACHVCGVQSIVVSQTRGQKNAQ